MKEITITVPDNCELKQDGNTYTIVEKEKKITYDDITKNLFDIETVYWTDKFGKILCGSVTDTYLQNPNNASTKKQLEKLLAINKLMNVAKYLNGDWKPDWDNRNENKWYINFHNAYKEIDPSYEVITQNCTVYFKSKELAEQAIEILGEETIKLALCTDY